MTDEAFKWIGPISSAVTALATIILGTYALVTWRRQLYGEHHFALARRIAKLLYRLGYQINEHRVWGLGGDGLTSLSEIIRLHAKLLDQVAVAHIMWGDEIKNAEKELTACVGKLWHAVRITHDLVNKNSTPGLTTAEIDAIIYVGTPDEFGDRLSAAVDEMFRILEKHLPAKLSVPQRIKGGVVRVNVRLQKLVDKVHQSGGV